MARKADFIRILPQPLPVPLYNFYHTYMYFLESQSELYEILPHIVTHLIQKIEYPIVSFFQLKSGKDIKNKSHNIVNNIIIILIFIGTFLCLVFLISTPIGFKNSLQNFRFSCKVNLQFRPYYFKHSK